MDKSEIDKIALLPYEKKKELLSTIIQNDVSYWKKILLLLNMMPEDGETDLFDLVVKHKIEEVELANKKYNLQLNNMESISSSEDNTEIINDLFSKVCREVLDVLKYIPTNYYERINRLFLEKLENNADSKYSIVINKDSKFDDLKISPKTKEVITMISEKYWNIDGKIVDIRSIFNK